MKRIAVVILAAGAALAAPAFAQTIVYQSAPATTFVWDPVANAYVELAVVVYEQPYVAPAPPVTYAAPAMTYAAPAEVVYANPIVVTAPRADEQYLINSGVADTIAADPSIRGYIETQTFRNNVTLNGRVTTPGMVDRAERDARSVDGVRDVENLIKPRVGGGF
ncbi:MAG TPA: BON domain-containing protein [Usitatibacter sp.]|jgi:hypothetical protein|nr:BON domain-containing protein [Usitatibacter sp.]